ncbi:MAG: amidohydrolase [Deltaproteobacteria bacterium]|jgi:predicted amidohydrolase YtcJ|nr:amidohydrolase [Deltaproteobacteria bacterium]MBT6502049.1 amidohydrolase [Deltaproteobacteria bacterium]MBT7154054.1 amidohydrolase [Deltaproteobacteria bacterium]MBT7714832.1 amidohydrolase [Deltaproteobacteria bacterium]MBT7888614.1 amidohydrolase [Deltaproteobacteria bacterium]
MDTIFYNGRINSLNTAGTVYSAVGVENRRISRLGSDAELKALSRTGTEFVDLKGAVMFPGFMESHNHFSIIAYLLNALDLSASKVSCMDDILSLVKAEAEKTAPGNWIKGSRYAEYFLAENRHPTFKDLDVVSPDHPVVLFHTSFHACTLNSKALAIMDIRKETPDPQGGKIEKDPASGEPTGVLHDQAMMGVFNNLFFADLEKMGPEERITFVEAASQKFAEVGLVFAADALVVPQVLNMYQEALAAGRLHTRLYTMNYAPLADGLVGSGIKTGFGSGMLRIGPIKLFADGGMSNRTAAVVKPYLTPPYDTGLKIYSPDELKENVKRFHDLGYQIAIHAQGDAGLADTLDAFEAVLGSQSDNPLRHRIEHAGCLYPDLLKRAADMNILAAVQPVFFSELGDGFIEAFGPELSHQLYPFRSMLNAGLRIGGSSDCPVSMLDPRKGLSGAVLRKTPSGAVLAPEEALTMDEAIRLYTQGSAYLSFDEKDSGTIEVGKRADFTVMAEDPRQVKPEEVLDIPFIMTVVDGRIVWSGESA